MLIFTHPTGNANVRHAALGLFRAGLLTEFWTCLNFHAPPLLERLLPGRIVGQLRRRAYPPELQPAIRSRPFHEAVRHVAPRLGFAGLVEHETGRFSVDAVYRALDRAVARRLRRGNFRAVYA